MSKWHVTLMLTESQVMELRERIMNWPPGNAIGEEILRTTEVLINWRKKRKRSIGNGLCPCCNIEPKTSRGYCKKCRAAYMRAWRLKKKSTIPSSKNSSEIVRLTATPPGWPRRALHG